MTTGFAVRRPLKTSTFSSEKTPLRRTNPTWMKSKTPPRRHPNMANSPARLSQARKSISATERGDASVATTAQRIGRTWNFTVNITDVLDETTSPSRAMKSTWERLLAGKKSATHQTVLSRTWQGSCKAPRWYDFLPGLSFQTMDVSQERFATTRIETRRTPLILSP